MRPNCIGGHSTLVSVRYCFADCSTIQDRLLNKATLGFWCLAPLYFCRLLFETMPRRNDAWDHWYDDLGVSTGRLQRQVKCKFYPLTIAYRADRDVSRTWVIGILKEAYVMFQFAGWFLVQQNNCLRIVEG